MAFNRMLNAVWTVMCDGHWRTLYEISSQLDHAYSEAGISARLRDFRKDVYRAEYHITEVSRRLRQGSKNLWEYRIVRDIPQPTDVQMSRWIPSEPLPKAKPPRGQGELFA